MKALVTGATGFVGSHLVEALVGNGDEVTALVRSPGKAKLLTQLGIRQVPGDLYDAPALANAVRDQDVIYHVAGADRRAQRGGLPSRQSRRDPQSPRCRTFISFGGALSSRR